MRKIYMINLAEYLDPSFLIAMSFMAIICWVFFVEIGYKMDKKLEQREKEIFEEVMRNKLNLGKKQ